MNGKSIGIIGFLVGVIVTLVFGKLPLGTGEPALAQGGAAGSGQLFGIGGLMSDNSGTGCLWVVEPETKQVAAYVCEGGRTIRFVGARKLTYDLKLRAVNDRTEKYTVPFLEAEWQRLNQKPTGQAAPEGKKK